MYLFYELKFGTEARFGLLELIVFLFVEAKHDAATLTALCRCISRFHYAQSHHLAMEISAVEFVLGIVV